MTDRDRRGGYQRPDNPAPVSGPGRLSERTDGGPGQPIRVPSGGRYGERQALVNQQQAAPLARSQGPAVGGAGPAPGAGSLSQRVGAGPGIGAPPQNPLARRSPGAAPDAPVAFPPDPDAMLRALYAVYPHPDIARYFRE